MEIFIKCAKDNYSNFEGKASRKEFWVFSAFLAVLTLALAFICGFLSGLTTVGAIRYLYLVFVLLMIVPLVAVATRRLHDTAKSGKMLLVGLIPAVGQILLVVWLCGKPSDGKEKKKPQNKNKPIPKAAAKAKK